MAMANPRHTKVVPRVKTTGWLAWSRNSEFILGQPFLIAHRIEKG